MTDEPEHPEPPGPDDDGRSRRRAGVPTIAPSEPETVGPPPREAARGSERRRRRRRNGVTLAVVVALVLAPLLVVGGWFVWQLDPPGGAGDPVVVEIQPGWGSSEAGDALARDGVVGSSLAFQLWATRVGRRLPGGDVPAARGHGGASGGRRARSGPGVGARRPAHAAAPSRAHAARRSPHRVGALPGHTRGRVPRAWRESGVVRSRYQPAESASLEGLTWPDTYFVGERQTDEEILRMVVSEFDEQADAAGLADAPTAGLTPYEALISASLIQARGVRPTTPPRCPAVIVNRLRQGIPLQIDATLCYAKGGCPPVPTNADKQIDSPYNTYRVPGLPPDADHDRHRRGDASGGEPGRRPLPLLRDRRRRRHALRGRHSRGTRRTSVGSG